MVCGPVDKVVRQLPRNVSNGRGGGSTNVFWVVAATNCAQPLAGQTPDSPNLKNDQIERHLSPRIEQVFDVQDGLPGSSKVASATIARASSKVDVPRILRMISSDVSGGPPLNSPSIRPEGLVRGRQVRNLPSLGFT